MDRVNALIGVMKLCCVGMVTMSLASLVIAVSSNNRTLWGFAIGAWAAFVITYVYVIVKIRRP